GPALPVLAERVQRVCPCLDPLQVIAELLLFGHRGVLSIIGSSPRGGASGGFGSATRHGRGPRSHRRPRQSCVSIHACLSSPGHPWGSSSRARELGASPRARPRHG